MDETIDPCELYCVFDVVADDASEECLSNVFDDVVRCEEGVAVPCRTIHFAENVVAEIAGDCGFSYEGTVSGSELTPKF